MLGFEPVEDSLVLLYKSGLYTESKLYIRRDQTYVKCGSGYAKLHIQNTTSINRLYWKEIHSQQGRAVPKGCELVWQQNVALAAE